MDCISSTTTSAPRRWLRGRLALLPDHRVHQVEQGRPHQGGHVPAHRAPGRWTPAGCRRRGWSRRRSMVERAGPGWPLPAWRRRSRRGGSAPGPGPRPGTPRCQFGRSPGPTTPAGRGRRPSPAPVAELVVGQQPQPVQDGVLLVGGVRVLVGLVEGLDRLLQDGLHPRPPLLPQARPPAPPSRRCGPGRRRCGCPAG